MTPRVLDVGTDAGVGSAVGFYSVFVFASGVYAGWFLGRRAKVRRA